MKSEVEKLALRDADSDWKKEKVNTLTISTMGVGPVLNATAGFYYKFFSHYRDERDSQYCNFYNAHINKLVSSNGIPAWAPLTKLPKREEILASLVKLTLPFDKYDGSFKEKKMVKYISSRKRYKPLVFYRDLNKGYIAIAGNLNSSEGEVDIIDLNEYYWMASYRYLKKHVGEFPWEV